LAIYITANDITNKLRIKILGSMQENLATGLSRYRHRRSHSYDEVFNEFVEECEHNAPTLKERVVFATANPKALNSNSLRV